MLEAGWWFECSCHECGRRVMLEYGDDDPDEDGEPVTMAPVAIGSSVFCNPACAGRQCAWWRGRKAAEAALC